MKKIARAVKELDNHYEEISKLNKLINKALEEKYEGIFVDHNWADGVIIVFDDEKNAPISAVEVEALLRKEVSVEEGLEYLRSKSI
jgi:hypothetical protein